jgi:hypothetical protein
MLVPREVLDRLRRSAPHREVRAERVAEDVDVARGLQACAPLRAPDPVAHRVPRHRGPVAEREHSVSAQMTVLAQRVEERFGQRHHPAPAALGSVDDALPVVDFDLEVAPANVDVDAAQGDDLAPTQPGVASQENRGECPRVDLAGRFDEALVLLDS